MDRSAERSTKEKVAVAGRGLGLGPRGPTDTQRPLPPEMAAADTHYYGEFDPGSG
ncbi:MAG: hypothetical protein ACKOEV_03175 [Cytophagales bacterium]